MTRAGHCHTRLINALLLAAALCGHDTFAAALPDKTHPTANASDSTAESPQPPLRSRAQLDAWLKANAGKPTPLDAFSAGGRERFLARLSFSEHGLDSLPSDEIAWELERTHAASLLKLFGREEWVEMLDYSPHAGHWKSNATTPSEMDRRYLGYIKEEDATYDKNGLQYERNVTASYLKHFPPSLVAHADQLDDPDLLILARATASTVRFTNGPQETQHLLSVLPRLQQRGLDVTPLATIAQRSLMALGQLDQARALASQYPSVKFGAIPAVKVAPEELATGPKWWRLSSDGEAMTAESVDVSDTQIFVLAGCHFSMDAAQDVRKDPELAPVFAQHAHWLGQPPGREDVAAWKEWNTKLPDTPMHLITRRSDRPMFPSWNMPTYAVVRGGKVIDKTTGSWRNYPEARVALVCHCREAIALARPLRVKAAHDGVRPPHANGRASAPSTAVVHWATRPQSPDYGQRWPHRPMR